MPDATSCDNMLCVWVLLLAGACALLWHGYSGLPLHSMRLI